MTAPRSVRDDRRPASDEPHFRAEPAISTGVEDDRLIAYALAADPVFTGMRALIGQVSGLLILAQARRHRDVAATPDIAIARDRLCEIVDCLARVAAPEERRGDVARLREATSHVADAIALVAEMRPKQTDESVAAASTHLKAAYRLMQAACDHRLGLTMVDASGACCSCGGRLA
jgi:hypothetical protein